ncbi:uncharacterized protein J4E87_006985 [Alternaria ethzedia]|uniref:uncharacterized protein n=1 Tax=Alternaria ethzedia TaxID=181014 RepID=UPI0020C49AD5|nr:uncharacterized protein J4E87_006985 [Alternaria ethzedia]KAI4620660.1 hypothetical protein J4E87_006985 [Alternaria ethzedia]
MNNNLERHRKKKHQSGLLEAPVKICDETQIDVSADAPLYSKANLMRVATSGDVAMLKVFLDSGISLDTKADDQSTALHCAARAGQAAAVEYLLMRGASVDLRNDKKRLSIHEAILSGHCNAVEPFFERVTQKVLLDMAQELESWMIRSGTITIVNAYIRRLGDDFEDRKASKKIQFAVHTGHSLLVATLLDDPDVDVNLIYRGNRALIHSAASLGRKSVMEILIACDRVDKTSETNFSRQALHIAASNGHTSIVEQLIRHPSVDVDCRDKYQATPLHYAVSNGHWETASFLLKHSESLRDGHCISSDVSPTSLSFTKEDLLHRLLKRPDFGGPNEILPGTLKTIIHVAASKGDCEVIEVLLAHPDIDVNKCVGYFGSPLMYAARNGKLEAARLLLQHKDVDVNQKTGDPWKHTALNFAKLYNHNEIVDLLLSHGAIDYDAKAPTTVPTTTHIDNPQSITLQPDHETQFDPFVDDVDDGPNEAWDEFLAVEEGMEE